MAAKLEESSKSSSGTGQIRFNVDSGSSNHFINNVSYLQDVRKLMDPILVDVAKYNVEDSVLLNGE